MKTGDANSPDYGSGFDAATKVIRRQAAEWLARRQANEFTPDDEMAFVKWCAANPRHIEIFSQVENSWRTFDWIAFYPRAAGAPIDPDILAPRQIQSQDRFGRFRRVFNPALVVTAAAAVVLLVWSKPWVSRAPFATPGPVGEVASRFLHLSDGSEIELNTGSEVTEKFTPAERRVRLVRGEAHFTVAKNAARPFIVEANGVAIRAVGTEFDVRLGANAVEVIVTEGVVQVHPPGGDARVPALDIEPSLLTAGQRTIMPTAAVTEPVKPVIETLAAAEIDRALAWQASRLVFDDTALAEVVTRFNRHSAGQPGALHLVLNDPELGAIRISGRIRSDRIDSFVEALETSFGVTADRRANGEIVLRKSR